MTRHVFCPVCGGMDCGTACKHPRRSLTEAQRKDLDERLLRRARRERDEALAKNTELGKVYLDAVSASQGHEMEAAMLEAERDAAVAQRDKLREALQRISGLDPLDGYDLHAAIAIAREALAVDDT